MTIRLNDKAVKLIGVLCVLALVGYGMLLAKNALTKPLYFYELGKLDNSFLSQTSVPVHTTKNTITKPLHIEYTVLKVPSVKTTAAKK